MQKTIEKLKILRELHQHQSMGYTYYKNTLKLNVAKDSFMPNDINSLNRTLLNCHLCQLSKTRKKVVLGEGNINSKIMFISEAPNASEDISGRPFAGKTGELFDKIIETMLNLKREDIYVSNIIKCKPSQNNPLNINDINLCKPYILKQISIVNPSIIITLGSSSFSYLTGDFETSFESVRGEVLQFGNAKLIPTLHPSYLIKNPSSKKDVFKDMLKVKGLL